MKQIVVVKVIQLKKAHGIVRIINNKFETKQKLIFILFAIYEPILLKFLKG